MLAGEVARRPVAGGDLNEAFAVERDDGRTVFLKTRANAAAGEYATEAAGLQWLGDAGGLPVPEVVSVGDDHLALAWVDSGGPLDDEALGRGLAITHAAGADAHGALPPGAQGELRIGPLSFPGTAEDWTSLYGEHRLAPLLPRASLSPSGRAAVERVIERLPELAGPPAPPARLHGDLWTGNVIAGADGRPWLIDPAAHGGHREMDLAMLRLFGAPSARLLAAYEEVAPLADGHEERVDLWQLFPLLVHSVLFGGGYAASAERAARRYC